VARGGRAGKIIDFVNFQKDGQCNVVPNQLEVRLREQVSDVRFLRGKKIVQANHIVLLSDQAFTKMRA